jgi:hypothetical protein
MIIQAAVSQLLKGRIRCQVVNARTGRVKRDHGWQNNLILNQGMNGIYDRSLAHWMDYAVAGTGTTPTFETSGVTQASQSGQTITLSGGSFAFTDTGTDSGRVIKWDSGEISMILSVTSPIVATSYLADAKTVASGTFTAYNTQQVALSVEGARTNNYLLGSGNTGTTYDFSGGNNFIYLQRSYDFPANGTLGTISYWEIGFSYNAGAGSNLFSRIKLLSNVDVAPGENLRVIYQVRVALSPSIQRANTPIISSWFNTDGFEICESIPIHIILDNGLSNYIGGGTAGMRGMEPFDATDLLFYSNDVSALRTAPNLTIPVNRVGTAIASSVVTRGAYTPMTFSMKKSATFIASTGNFSGIRTVGLGSTTGGSAWPGLTFRFTNAQTKLNTVALTLNFQLSWGRILS